jgi:hypothetical protein
MQSSSGPKDLFVQYFTNTEYTAETLSIYIELLDLFLPSPSNNSQDQNVINLRSILDPLKKVRCYLLKTGQTIDTSTSSYNLGKLYDAAQLVTDCNHGAPSAPTSSQGVATSFVSILNTVHIQKLLSPDSELNKMAKDLNKVRFTHFVEKFKNRDDTEEFENAINKFNLDVQDRDKKIRDISTTVVMLLSSLPDVEARKGIEKKLNGMLEYEDIPYRFSGTGGGVNDKFKNAVKTLILGSQLSQPQVGVNAQLLPPRTMQTSSNDPLGTLNLRTQLTNFLINITSDASSQGIQLLGDYTTINDPYKTINHMAQNGDLSTLMLSPQIDIKQVISNNLTDNSELHTAFKLALTPALSVQAAKKLDEAISLSGKTLQASLLAISVVVSNLLSILQKRQVVDKVAAKAKQVVDDDQRSKLLLSILPESLSAQLLSTIYNVNTMLRLQDKSPNINPNELTTDKFQMAFNKTITQMLTVLMTAVQKVMSEKGMAQKDMTSAIQELASNDEFKKMVEEQIKQIHDNYKGTINQRLEALEKTISSVDISSIRNDATFLKEHTKHLAQLIQPFLSLFKPTQGGPYSGGSEDLVQKAKETRKELDNIKKLLRGTTDALGALSAGYDRILPTLKQAQEAKQPEPPADKATADPKQEDANAAKFLGLETAVKEDGQKFYQEVVNVVKEKKEDLKKVLSTLQSIFDQEPGNSNYVNRGLEIKRIVEGDYDKQGEDGMGLLSWLDKLENTIKTEYEGALSNLKSIAEGIKQEREFRIREAQSKATMVPMMMGQQPFRGGNDDGFKGIITKVVNIINENIFKNIVQITDTEFLRKSNPVMAAALGTEPSLFQMIYNNYLDAKAKKNPTVAMNELSASLEANRLIPSEALAITGLDKTVFVFVMLFIRLFALSATEKLIEKGYITKLSTSLLIYLGFYTAIMLIFAGIVNVDVYRLRIIFNYINFHANAGRLMMHIVFLWLFSFLILLMIWHINIGSSSLFSKQRLSSEGKADIMYRLEVITMILWLFLLLTIVIF